MLFSDGILSTRVIVIYFISRHKYVLTLTGLKKHLVLLNWTLCFDEGSYIIYKYCFCFCFVSYFQWTTPRNEHVGMNFPDHALRSFCCRYFVLHKLNELHAWKFIIEKLDFEEKTHWKDLPSSLTPLQQKVWNMKPLAFSRPGRFPCEHVSMREKKRCFNCNYHNQHWELCERLRRPHTVNGTCVGSDPILAGLFGT